MTEDEAKTKWCPFARVDDGSGALVAWNRRTQESLGHRRENLCIGSTCMAWRWNGEAPPIQLGSVDGALSIMGTAEQRVDVRARQQARRSGHCGLAGSPQ